MIEIIGRNSCSICKDVKGFLEGKNVRFEYSLLEDYSDYAKNELLELAGSKNISTMPLVIVDNELITVEELKDMFEEVFEDNEELKNQGFEIFSEGFLNQYPDFPEHMTDLGKFVYLRTYSRYLNDKQRRETWKETVKRAVTYNMMMEVEHCQNQGILITKQRSERIKKEAVELFESMFNLNQFLAGRTLWAGDVENKKLKEIGLSQFNCSHVIVDNWDNIRDIFYALMVGTGTGISCRLEHADKLKPIRAYGYEVKYKPYEFVGIDGALEDTKIEIDNDKILISVGDSKTAWCDSLKYTLDILTESKYKNIKSIEYNFDYVRPSGHPLKTFGGQSSGHEPLKEMFEGLFKVIRNELNQNQDPLIKVDEEYVKVRPIHILDICNLVGYNVVVGGKH